MGVTCCGRGEYLPKESFATDRWLFIHSCAEGGYSSSSRTPEIYLICVIQTHFKLVDDPDVSLPFLRDLCNSLSRAPGCGVTIAGVARSQKSPGGGNKSLHGLLL